MSSNHKRSRHESEDRKKSSSSPSSHNDEKHRHIYSGRWHQLANDSCTYVMNVVGGVVMRYAGGGDLVLIPNMRVRDFEILPDDDEPPRNMYDE